MEGPRQRWLLGAHPTRTKVGACSLACLGVVLAVVAWREGLAPGSWALPFVLAAPPLAGLAYAGWNGGPLVAVPVTQLGALLAALDGATGLVAQHAYVVFALPAGLAAFGIAAHTSQVEVGGGRPLGDARLGAALLFLWLVVVGGWALLLAQRPLAVLGPALVGRPEWLGWLRSFTLWAPAGFALGWAVVRRGPALAFALATTPAWAWYLAQWLGADPRAPLQQVGEALLPPSVDALRGPLLLALGLLAMLLAVAFEPAWPRPMQRSLARGGARAQQG
ncbi:MAG: hypothetical protein LC624_09440 [Halobacteriales archaeon]|nr:hypothetical protein [Halobacteriales archaeon]